MNTREQEQYKFYAFLCMGYITFGLASLVLFPLVINAGAFEISASLLPYPLACLICDITTEVYGYSLSRRLIWSGLAWVNIFAILISLTSSRINILNLNSSLPGYLKILMSYFQFMLAGTVAVFATSFVNSYVISKTKILLHGKKFWLRSYCAILIGELVNTLVVFIVGMMGFYSFKIILEVIITAYLFKIIYAIPLAIIGTVIVFYLKKFECSDPYDTATSFNPFKLN